MDEIISHLGVIQTIEGQHVSVRIVQSSACSTCQAKSLCASAESKEKIVDVWCRDAGNYAVGDEVEVCGSLSMGRKAVVLAFVVPLVLVVVGVVLGLHVLGWGEAESIVGMLVLLAVYYAVLALFRKRLSRSFSFWIKKREI